ncbi:hypothetical protein C922_00799 [Plasmodium inui San Antonio 1]|uniref:Uncharacterized protein n=1 Tax=Plasmodium inui San Antonio 1 TaxID=1237626 RepID=W7A7G7_9APIC|nr:hypothetical protein C922_00799 [Plasmodium inui San Antonio 1]EUD69107.1 hypothetical protein C922_00799 [Plasmodium inui San Antonio 1]
MEGKFSMQRKAAVGNKKSTDGKHVIRGTREGGSHKVEKEMGKQKRRPNGEGKGAEETEWGAGSNRKCHNPLTKGKAAHRRFNSSMFRNSHRSGNMRGVAGKGKHQGGLYGGGRKSRNGAERWYPYGGISVGDAANQYGNHATMEGGSEGGGQDGSQDNENSPHTFRDAYYYDNDSSAASEGEAPMGQMNHAEETSSKQPRINSDQQPTMDYVEYMNHLKKGEDPNVDKKDTLDSSEGKEEVGRDAPADEHHMAAGEHEEGVFKIFLLFSPLAVTSIRNRKCVINADEHMSFLEKKLETVQDLMSGARSAKEKVFLRAKVEAIENKLRNKVMLNLMLRNVVLDPDGRPLLKVLPHPVKRYVGSSVCIGISNMGFPADVKKLSKKIKETKNDYSFFLSLSAAFDLTHFIESISRNESECFPLDYVIRVSDLPLSTVAICSKLTHFLND